MKLTKLSMTPEDRDISWVFFGSPHFSVDILEVLQSHGLTPDLVVTAPDRPRGRGQKLQPTPVGTWAKTHQIPALKPEKINASFITDLKEAAPTKGWDVFVVVAYGHILPAELIYLPHQNTLNLHPSLLPKLRGPAPIRGAILEEDKTGVTIIELDEEMDHGPIVLQKAVETTDWPPTYPALKTQLTKAGGQLLAEAMPDWVAGNIKATTQDHSCATYSQKFSAEDGEINLADNPAKNLRKIRAFTDWPKAHFFSPEKNRVLITKAHLAKDELIIDRVKPAGEEELGYKDFLEKSD